MTKEQQAIAIIENEKKCVNRANNCNRDCYNCELVKTDIEILTAYDMAIKALEQQSIAEERYQDLIEYFGDENVAKCVLEDREEFKKWLERIKWYVRKADELARKLEQQPCDDCVSRQATLDAIIKKLCIKDESYLLPSEKAIYNVVKNMPPVTPTHGTCKDCKNNRKNPYARKHYTCELGNRCKLRDCDNFYCADFEK